MWLWRMTQRSAWHVALCASFRAESGAAWIAIDAQGQSMRPLRQGAIPFRVRIIDRHDFFVYAEPCDFVMSWLPEPHFAAYSYSQLLVRTSPIMHQPQNHQKWVV